ncbi:MAG: AAA family ATPase [Armatimonadota bacterium]|nr:AAA family ATPase [Armatimonadota bacterium]
MRLRRLRVRRFRRLRGLEITFHPGLNVIVGPNEAGKSTLREAIIMALYGNAATTSQAIRESTRSWGSDRPAVLELEFEADGEVYTLGKDFHGRKVFLRDSKGNNWEGHARIQREIGTLLGFPNENLYRSTAHVAQAELDRLSTDTPDIAKELSRIITGGGQDANVVTVLHRLEQAIEAQRKGLQRYAKDPGPIKRLENIVTSLEGRRAELLQKAQQAIQSRKEIIEVSKELERAATTLTIKDNLLKVNQELMRVENRLQELKTQESQLGDRIRKIHQNILKLSQIKEEIAALIGEGEVPDEETMHKLRETYAFYSGAASRAERLAEEVRAMEGSLAQFPRFAGRAVSALLTLAGVSLIAGMVLSAWRGIVWGGLTALPGVLFLLFAYKFWKMEEARRIEEDRLEARRKELEVARRDAGKFEEEMRQLLKELRCNSLEEATRRYEHYQRLVGEQRALAQSLQDLQGDQTVETLQEQYQDIQREIFVRTEYLKNPEVAAKRLLPLEVQHLEEEVERLRTQVRQLEQRKQRLEWEIEHYSPALEELKEVEEQLDESKERLQLERNRLRVYEMTYEVLREAHQQVMVPAREVVSSRAGEYLKVLTGGRYHRVRMTEDSLRVEVWVDEAQRWISPKEPEFSRGAIDQVYLATRLALVEVLAQGKSPPLVLDDPFVHFDEERLQAAIDLIRRLSSRYQVLLFTCRGEYSKYADHLIHIDTLSGIGIQ